jgi:hypothetical protein
MIKATTISSNELESFVVVSPIFPHVFQSFFSSAGMCLTSVSAGWRTAITGFPHVAHEVLDDQGQCRILLRLASACSW